ncbi:SAM-dependent methyltransferase [Ancylobacter radicis]|uniref:Class I SAM-dependent methyltransferase n=1 Tax=Ancylobacter radicis TaxID=2836179 RepID=A0ABS5R6Z5_9HYPH|nr:cyclopropane-fatty-acyl-phospholipid synthase family protein [Ancylobacter radicis]MBS9477435.1 class I SAM-dependent methyltransferase [Ancylobacter radicis]
MLTDSDHATATARPARRDAWLGRFVMSRLLATLTQGRLNVVLPGGLRIAARGDEPGPEATLVLHRWRAIRRLITAGDIGFSEAYVDGDWSSPDLAAFIELAALNQPKMARALSAPLPLRLWNRVSHALNANSKTGSRRNISFHYDLGNAFYRLWLDPSMNYSSAIYADRDQTLEEAQRAKIARILDMLELKTGDAVLEIGCGWGDLAGAMGEAGARVTGLTLSREQLAYAGDLMVERGLKDQVELRLQDYRDTEGRFDRIVSIEMLEAVGERYWPVYFETLRARLAAGGTAVLQVITIAEDRFDDYRRNPDFIQRYVFPGGMLPTKALIAEHAQAAGLTLEEAQYFGEGYGLTLAEWRHRFHAAWPEVQRLGFNDQFRRLWDYYLAYCEGGFRSGAIDVGLYKLRG